MADVKAPAAPKKAAGVAKWAIILGIAALGIWLYLKHKNSAGAADTSAASQGSTNASPSVPVYSQSASGTYNGAYTPYSIYNLSSNPNQSTYNGNGSVATQTTTEGASGIDVTDTLPDRQS